MVGYFKGKGENAGGEEAAESGLEKERVFRLTDW